MRHKKGFTLVELLVVIAIIAILLAVLLPAMAGVKEQGKRLQCGVNLRSISKAIGFYADQNDGKLLYNRNNNFALPEDRRPVVGHPYVAYRSGWFKQGSTTELLALNLACLYDVDIITDPRTFYCPAATIDTFMWESYRNPMPWERLPKEFVADSGNQWVRTGYMYRPMSKEWDEATRSYGYAFRLRDINQNRPWVTDTLWTRDSLNHVAGNRNAARGVYAAFPDGHVKFTSNPAMFSDEFWVNDTTQLRPDTWQFSAVLSLMEP